MRVLVIPDVREALLAAARHYRFASILARERRRMLDPLQGKTPSQLWEIGEQRRLERLHLRRAEALEGLMRADE